MQYIPGTQIDVLGSPSLSCSIVRMAGCLPVRNCCKSPIPLFRSIPVEEFLNALPPGPLISSARRECPCASLSQRVRMLHQSHVQEGGGCVPVQLLPEICGPWKTPYPPGSIPDILLLHAIGRRTVAALALLDCLHVPMRNWAGKQNTGAP